ncbi:hypothetical protein [Methanosarcina sp. MSH10X1]|uniref:hypothetical protein n=1 Tax=Methanosarcina sp. MSH10X1 TaxID=2507075 RepID=UPI001F0C9BC2|nr:hypothetical protein [Methanosarcina sp. MSH10X1]
MPEIENADLKDFPSFLSLLRHKAFETSWHSTRNFPRQSLREAWLPDCSSAVKAEIAALQ